MVLLIFCLKKKKTSNLIILGLILEGIKNVTCLERKLVFSTPASSDLKSNY